jgi:Fe-Mn family superoxide dismutase
MVPEAIRTSVINNGGGVYNHNLFFAGLDSTKIQNQIDNVLMKTLNATFGSLDDFKKEFKKQALSVFGSGYTWLVAKKDGAVEIVNTKNQDTVLPMNVLPLLTIDVWEHAYYLKHYNVRADYIDDWFKVVNLSRAEMIYGCI